MTEKLCLKLNDFQENLNSAFGSLREDKDFTDVTLACVDGKQLESHKVILATSSPFFQNLFVKNKHDHPIVYLKGMNSEALVAILDFVYYGEVNVDQDNLEAFLAIAEEFQLKGLTGNIYEEEVKENTGKQIIQPTQYQPIQKQYQSTQKQNQPKQTVSNNGVLPSEEISSDIMKQSNNVVIPNNFSEDFKELDEIVNSMIEKNETLTKTRHTCKVCGKEGHRNDIKKHIEANHLEGVSIPCKFCEKTFRSRKSLREHTLKYHR